MHKTNPKMKSDKFMNKYRIPSARKPDWDYRSKAIYFITICTRDRMHYFGNIENGSMNLSEKEGCLMPDCDDPFVRSQLENATSTHSHPEQ